ncbi:hypothetical protein M8J75_001598 [Diaphorina citri]|nr:hypothetical protein M8J75_001598 [Diaphorina citri]
MAGFTVQLAFLEPATNRGLAPKFPELQHYNSPNKTPSAQKFQRQIQNTSCLVSISLASALASISLASAHLHQYPWRPHTCINIPGVRSYINIPGVRTTSLHFLSVETSYYDQIRGMTVSIRDS